MRKWLNIYFNFSRRECNGLLILVLLLAVITSIPSIYDRWVPDQYDLKAERSAISKLILITKEKKKDLYRDRNRPAIKTKLFPFDPNHTSLADWQLLGLSVKQAAVLIKYTEKGGVFRKKEDLRKMYTINEEKYEQLEPYIYIVEKTGLEQTVLKSKYPASPYPERRKLTVISLNTADTTQLTIISGVGPAFARRIFNYRQRLGGFYKKEQLMEVFGLDSVKYQEIKVQVSIDSQYIVKLAINTVGYDDLKGHPYLTYKQVNAILQYRKQHGNYSNIEDLKKVVILSAETIEKLTPYISFNHD